MQSISVDAIKTFLMEHTPVIGNKFEIAIEQNGSAGENITMAVANVNLPGQTFSTNPGGNPGPEVKHPYQVAYEDAVISFLTTGNLDQRIYFEEWMDQVNPRTRNGYSKFKYRKSYISDVKISTLDNLGGNNYTATLHGAYPIAIQATELSHANEAIMTTNVTLTYVNYTS